MPVTVLPPPPTRTDPTNFAIRADAFLAGLVTFSTEIQGVDTDLNAYRSFLPINAAGQVGVGGAGWSNSNLHIVRELSDSAGTTTANGVLLTSAIPSGTTASARGFRSTIASAAATFTVGSVAHFQADPATKGAGSTITNQYGFAVESSLTGATNNFGFWSNVASATGRWNFFAAGTASNYFAGNVQFGSTTAITTRF
ncbi:hypothetical protein, partial [Caldimonas tepidiphila]|uniref:hypothetical protein n=1 Tax=Caldimonas tepidiphila TaxID=2315841 RepID=UPI001300866D